MVGKDSAEIVGIGAGNISPEVRHALWWLGTVVGVLVLSMPLGFAGTGDPLVGPAAVMQHAWWLVLAVVLWLLWGGRIVAALGARHGAARAIGAALALAGLVLVSAALGMAGMIGPLVPVTGWLTPIALAGLALGIIAVRRAGKGCARSPALVLGRAARMARIDWRWRALGLALVLPGVSLLLLGSAIPPGALWASEANGYDVLSYHLQLPREWQSLGRASVLEHNVYSALPLYGEVAFATLSAGFGRLLADLEPRTLVLASGWHAGCALLCALVLGRSCRAMAGRCAGLVAGAFALAVPWVIVTGSLAYNEHLVNACFAAALGLAVLSSDRLMPRGWAMVRMHAAALGAMIGLLLGVATGAKPTAFFFCVPVVVLALIEHRDPRRLARIIPAAMVGGLIALLPWLVRNWLELGNPVFPYATHWFGTAHWSDEQVSRWAAAHAPDGGLGDRLRLLVGERGFGHAQWGVFPIVVVIASFIAAMNARTRRLALVLVGGMSAQGIAWLLIGHQQSRFLLAAVVPGALLVGLSCAGADGWRRGHGGGRAAGLLERSGAVFALCGVLVLIAQSWMNYLGQNRFRDPSGRALSPIGAPAMALNYGVGGFTGWAFFDELDRLPPGQRIDFYQRIGPTASINHALVKALGDAARDGRGADPVRLLLVGDATPLYFLDAPGFTLHYATTWDSDPLGEALRTHAGDVAAALGELHRQGFTHLLVNTMELARLERSGYLDRAITREAVLAILEARADERAWFAPIMEWFEGRVVLLGPGDGSAGGAGGTP